MAAFALPVFVERPVFGVAVALLRAVVFFADAPRPVAFFAEDPRAVVFLAAEPPLLPAFLASVLRVVDFPFDEVAFLVELALLFFDEVEDFFVEELLFPDDLRADEAALFFGPVLFLAVERELVDFLVVGIVICPSKITGIGLILQRNE